MTEETPFEKYIQQLGFTLGSPEWRSMTLAERVLASFAGWRRSSRARPESSKSQRVKNAAFVSST